MRQFHPITQVFPLMEGKAFDELVEDIRINGLRHPVIIDIEGRIIDGRNRARACHQLGDEDPEYRLWDGEGSLTAFIVSMNLHRRHLSVKERGLIAAKLVTTSHGGNRKDGSRFQMESCSLADAADLMKVSQHTVQRAHTILEHGDPDLVTAVQQGDLSLEQAVNAINAKKPGHHARTREGRAERIGQVRELARQGHTSRQMAATMDVKEDTIRSILKKHGIDCPGDRVAGRSRRMTAGSLMENLVFTAEHLLADVDLINFSELDPDRLAGWIKELKTAHRLLGVFIRQLTGRKDTEHGKRTEDRQGTTDSAGCEDPSSPDQHDADSTGTGHPKGIQ